MAVIEMINGKRYRAASGRMKRISYKTHASMRKLIDYIYADHKTEEVLKQGLNCSPETAYREFLLTKQLYDKTENGNRRMAIHFTQSFKAGEVTPENAAKMAKELLLDSMFDGFQVAYATHVDRDHVHTHFVINTCNFKDGHMWQMSAADLQHLKDLSDEICRQNGLSVIQKNFVQKKQHMTYGEYKAAEQGASWIRETKLAVDNVLKIATSREDFIGKMEQLGYQTTWSNERKYITFTFDTPDGVRKLRNSRLRPPEKYTKEEMERRFALNYKYQQEQKETNAGKTEVDQMMVGAGILFKLMANWGKQTKYPYQRHEAMKTDSVQARKERAREAEKGYGLDWEG